MAAPNRITEVQSVRKEGDRYVVRWVERDDDGAEAGRSFSRRDRAVVEEHRAQLLATQRQQRAEAEPELADDELPDISTLTLEDAPAWRDAIQRVGQMAIDALGRGDNTAYRRARSCGTLLGELSRADHTWDVMDTLADDLEKAMALIETLRSRIDSEARAPLLRGPGLGRCSEEEHRDGPLCRVPPKPN